MAYSESPSGPMKEFSFLKLPSELIQTVFGHLSYDEISRCRSVCKTVDRTCQKILDSGFHRVERFHAQSLHRVKAQLPRRESERRTHELARHADILTSIETRLSLLSMTYGKYIDGSLCCFIPGKVLDEMFRVLRIVNLTPRGDIAPRPHELLQELRDISSMAMEHFEEHIVPLLRDRISVSSSSASNPATASLSTSALVLYAAASGSPPLLSVTGFSAVSKTNTYRSNRAHGASSAQINQQCESFKKQWQAQRSELAIYKRELAQLRATQNRQKDKMSEMEKRLNEQEQRFIDILAQLRNNGLSVATHSAVGGMMVDSNCPTASTGAGARRKRSAQNGEGPSAGRPGAANKRGPLRTSKRQKLIDSKPEGR